MAKKDKKNDKTYEWLLKFEKMAKTPVVVSLLIERGRVVFRASVEKKAFLGLDVDEEDEGDGGGHSELPPKPRLTSKTGAHYIG